MKTFDVVYLNTQKQVQCVTITVNDRQEAYKSVGSLDDCRKYRGVPNITSINQRASASI